MNSQEIARLDDILQKHDYNATLLIAIMQDIQKVYHYLPEEALCYIARKLKISEAKIYGVATFYENFSLEPKGRYVIKICDGTACLYRQRPCASVDDAGESKSIDPGIKGGSGQ